MSKRELFISFEGGEGAGKTTQINHLAQNLTAKGYAVLTTREPGGTSEAESIRSLLVQRDGGAWTPMAECLLLFAARVMHVETVIIPALEEGKIVITDRFTDSTRTYQGHGHGLSLEKIKVIGEASLGSFEPDLTFVLDIDPKTGLSRSQRRLAAEDMKAKQSEDRFENLDLDFHTRLRDGYLQIAKDHPARCRVIDATLSVEDMAAEIQGTTIERLA